MAVQNLQSLVLRAASFAGARATGLESKDLFAAMVDNPAGALSLPGRPLPGQHPMQIGTKPAESRRSYAPDSFGRRAGRSASNAGVVGCNIALTQLKRS
jgi:hypothetical protein